jgi:hypothetical protein
MLVLYKKRIQFHISEFNNPNQRFSLKTITKYNLKHYSAPKFELLFIEDLLSDFQLVDGLLDVELGSSGGFEVANSIALK